MLLFSASDADDASAVSDGFFVLDAKNRLVMLVLLVAVLCKDQKGESSVSTAVGRSHDV